MYDQIFEETRFMLRHAMSRGLNVSPNIPTAFHSIQERANKEDSRLDKEEYEKLANLHQTLVKIIAPATPRTVTLLGREREKSPLLYFLGSLPILRQFSLLAIAFLIGFIGLAQDSRVGIDPTCVQNLERTYQVAFPSIAQGSQPGISTILIDTPSTAKKPPPPELINSQCNNLNKGFVNLHGINLVLVELFLICCAGIGGVFANLYRINRYVGKGIWDDKYHATYWTTLIMGLMSGIVIAELIPIESSFGKPLVALLGGFAGDLVYNILREIVRRIEAPFVDLNEKVLHAEYDLRSAKQKYDTGHQRLTLALELSALKKNIKDSNNSEELQNKIDSIISDFLHDDTEM